MLSLKFKLDPWWIGLIGIAVFLRLILASFLFHTDLKGHYQEAQLTWDGIAAGYERGVKENTPLHYPPVIYILYNTHRFIDGWMFSPYFSDWLNDTSFLHLEQNPNIFRDLLVMKLPIIIFDFLTAWVLILIVPAGRKRLAAALWLLNPFSLYAIYFFGQFDIIAAFLTLFSVYLWHKKKLPLAYGVLGLAAAVKVFPLLILPVFLIYDPRSLIKKIISSGIFMGVFLVCLAPILTSAIALKSVFLSNLTGGLFQTSLALGGGKFLPVFLVVYLLILGGLLLNYFKKPVLEAVIFILLTFLLVLSDFHPQWMVWIMPLLVLLLAQKLIGWIESLVFLTGYLGVSLLINDKFVGLGTLKAMNESFDSIPSIRFFTDKVGLGLQIQSLLNALLVVCAGLFSLQIFKNTANFQSLKTEKISLAKITFGWLGLIAIVLFLAHIPLAVFGRYVDVDQMKEHERIELSTNTVVSQKIKAGNNNFNSLELRLKNIGLQSRDDILVSLTREDGTGVFSQQINGGSIGDDYNLLFKFPPIPDSKDQVYTLTVSQPNEVIDPKEVIILPYDASNAEGGLTINEMPVSGSLAYTTFYNPGGVVGNMQITLSTILRKI